MIAFLADRSFENSIAACKSSGKSLMELEASNTCMVITDGRYQKVVLVGTELSQSHFTLTNSFLPSEPIWA